MGRDPEKEGPSRLLYDALCIEHAQRGSADVIDVEEDWSYGPHPNSSSPKKRADPGLLVFSGGGMSYYTGFAGLPPGSLYVVNGFSGCVISSLAAEGLSPRAVWQQQ